MHILTVTHFYESHRGGIELVAGRLQRELATLGAEVSWAASAQDSPPNDGAIMPQPLHCIDPLEAISGLPMPIPLPRTIAQLWRNVKAADAVIIHDALYVTSILAMLAAKWHKKKTLLIQHIGDIPFSSALLRGLLALANRIVARPMLRRADYVIFISDTVRRYFGDLRRTQPAHLMFNGVDHQRFHLPSADQRQAARKTWNIADGVPHFLFVGRFVEKKGLKILKEIASQLPMMQFHLAGSGPINPTSWGLANIHVHGPQSADKIASLMHAVDAFILPSTGEGYPLVVQEALASGLPLFCGAETAEADPQAAPYLLGSPVNLADPTDSARGFVTKIKAAQFGPHHAAAAYARARYDWAANGRAIMGFLR
jgi:glycosyltransferase involved in cell wall biosynthesis